MIVAYVKLVMVFALMLFGIRLHCGLGVSVLFGSFVMALLFGISPMDWFYLAIDIFSDTSILVIWCVVVCVLSLSHIMESTKQAERFMSALAYRVTSPRVRMVLFPMLIGLLPMPGGAVFSAPMINAVSKELPMPEQGKSIINYWFRHTVEMSWPLYPAMIMAASLGGISTPSLVMWTFPLSIAFFCIGWIFFVRPHVLPPPNRELNTIPEGNVKSIFKEGLPLLVAVGGALLCEAFFALFLPQYPMDYGVVAALVAAVTVCLLQNRLGVATFVQTVMKPSVRAMIFVVAALGVFKNVIAGGGIVESLISKDAGMVALWLCAILLPWVMGALTGLMMAAVGAAFPLLMALVEASGAGPVTPWLMIGLVSVMTGAMMSPLHICFILSCQYFKVSLPDSVKKVFVPSLCFLAVGLVYFFILQFFLRMA